VKANVNRNTRLIALVGLLAAIKVVTTVALAPISYGPVQMRIANIIDLSAFYFGPFAVVANTLASVIINMLGSNGLPDILLGLIQTPIVGYVVWKCRNQWVGGLLFTVISAMGVATMLHYVIGLPWVTMALTVGAGQLASVVIGIPVLQILDKRLNLRKYRV